MGVYHFSKRHNKAVNPMPTRHAPGATDLHLYSGGRSLATCQFIPW